MIRGGHFLIFGAYLRNLKLLRSGPRARLKKVSETIQNRNGSGFPEPLKNVVYSTLSSLSISE